jgi:hypothetical protein
MASSKQRGAPRAEFTPVEFTKGDSSRHAFSPAEVTQLTYDGWRAKSPADVEKSMEAAVAAAQAEAGPAPKAAAKATPAKS